jgi:hypothetical protein
LARGCGGKPAFKNRLLDQLTSLAANIRKFISESVALSRDESAFNALALEAFRFQFEFNPGYRRYAEFLGFFPECIENYRQIPAIPAAAFKEQVLSVLPELMRRRVFFSSGTTLQKTSRHFHSSETLALYEHSLLAWFEPFLLPRKKRARFVVLTPSGSETPNSSLVHMFETVAREFGSDGSFFAGHLNPDGSWEVDHEKVLSGLRAGADFGEPILLCGTAFCFVHLCDAIPNSGLELPPGSAAFETGGYKGRSRILSKEALHGLISEKFRLPDSRITSEYGMSELSSQAYDRRVGDSAPRRFQFPPWARVEFISPETAQPVNEGETGLIRVYDLANVGSVLAIQTEDLGRKFGDGFELMGRAVQAEPRGCSSMSAV